MKSALLCGWTIYLFCFSYTCIYAGRDLCWTTSPSTLRFWWRSFAGASNWTSAQTRPPSCTGSPRYIQVQTSTCMYYHAVHLFNIVSWTFDLKHSKTMHNTIPKAGIFLEKWAGLGGISTHSSLCSWQMLNQLLYKRVHVHMKTVPSWDKWKCACNVRTCRYFLLSNNSGYSLIQKRTFNTSCRILVLKGVAYIDL